MREKAGNYTLLRMICAFEVFYGHLVTHFALDQTMIGGFPIIRKLLEPFSGVPIFFALSGYFIWHSLSVKNDGVSVYAKKRFIRIFPELWIAVAASVICILCQYRDELSPVPFIAWILTQSTVMQFWTPDCLRGYGVSCPNGSLWTIPVFIQFYIAVYLLHKVLHNRSLRRWGCALLLCVPPILIPGMLSAHIPEILQKLYGETLFPYLLIFMSGAFLCEYRQKAVPLLSRKWVLLVLYFILLFGLPVDLHGVGYPVLRSILQALMAVSFGLAVNSKYPRRDISYEIYLIHMIVVNSFLECGFAKSWTNFWIVLAITAAAAILLRLVSQKIIRALSANGKKRPALPGERIPS